MQPRQETKKRTRMKDNSNANVTMSGACAHRLTRHHGYFYFFNRYDCCDNEAAWDFSRQIVLPIETLLQQQRQKLQIENAHFSIILFIHFEGSKLFINQCF